MDAPPGDLVGTITPADLHFERHHGGVPEIDPKTYSLLIHGMVERPTVFTLADLKRFPSVSRICFLECSGNFTRTAQTNTTAQQIAGLTSQSEWTGVMLSTLFREVGVGRRRHGSSRRAQTPRCCRAASPSRRDATMR